MRSIGLLPEARCRSEAFCSNIKLKNASILAIIFYAGRLLAKSTQHCKPLNDLATTIAEEISKRGAIPFARFMELALYCPVYGYYEKQRDNIGRRGDYYTSVSVGPLFGEMLAFQFAEWADAEGRGAREERAVQLIEAGAHQGDLAMDILSWLREHRAELWQRLEYMILEPSAARRVWQREKLQEFAEKIRWVNDWSAIPHRPYRIIFANELLDSFPVHSVGWDAGKRAWFEWGVTVEDGKFAWARLSDEGEGARDELAKMLSHSHALTLSRSDAQALLPDAFTTELCPAAIDWWKAAAESLQTGKLLTFDYGLMAEEFFAPHRGQGTLRAFYKHRPSDVLANVGEQDLTAQVNFTALQEAGEALGLKTEALLSQSRFLTDTASKMWNKEFPLHHWGPKRTRQFQTLIHPEHLGRFKVMIQSHGSGCILARAG